MMRRPKNIAGAFSSIKKRPFFAVRLALLGLLFGGLWSCLDEITLNVPKGTDDIIVIQGQVIKGDPSRINVSVSRLFDFTSDGRQRVNVRTVLLSDDAGNQIEIPSIDLGIYELRLSANDVRFRIEEDKSYRLTIGTFDGRTYVSDFENMQPLVRADSLSARKITKEVPDGRGGFTDRDFFQYGIHTDLSKSETGDRPYLRWVIERTYRLTDGSAFIDVEPKTCYITQRVDLTNVMVLDPNLIIGDRLDGVTVAEDVINFFYAEGHYINVYQQTVSEEVFRYWSNIGTVIERSGNMFEPPAGKITSNFVNVDDPDDEAFGYFFVVQQDTLRFYTSPEAAGSPDRLCPPVNEQSPNGQCASGACCDCLIETGSTLRRPRFWVH